MTDAAGVTAALGIRYFGSEETRFTEDITPAYTTSDVLDGSLDDLAPGWRSAHSTNKMPIHG